MDNTENYNTLSSWNQGSWEWDLASGKLCLDSYGCELFGHAPQETPFDTSLLKSIIHPDDHKLFFNAVEQLSRHSNKASTIVCRLMPRNENLRWVECIITALAFDDTGKASKISGHFIDITTRKEAEIQLQTLNRSLKAISSCNQALLRTNDEMELLNEICRTVVEIGGYRMAWVGYAQDDPGKNVLPVAWAGVEDGYLETLQITWADSERGRGPSGTAIRTGQASVANDMQTDPQFGPWRSEALKRGFASSLGLPLKNAKQVFGALMIYATTPNAFDADEITLLTSLADNLAYGINMLQNRKEKERAEEAMRQSEARYRSLFQNRHTVMLIIDKETGAIIDANPAAINYYGYSLDELCRMNIGQINTLTKEQIQTEMHRAHEQHCSYFAFQHRLADGSVRDVEVVSGPITVDGNALLYSIVNDVTDRKLFQEQLLEGSKRLHYIMSATDAGLWETSTGSTRDIWSDEVWELYGLAPQSCKPSYENWINTIIPEDREMVRAQAEKAVATSSEFNTIYRVRGKDGTIHWLLSKGTPFADAEGKIRFVGIVIDITDRKKEEEAKQLLEAQLRKAQRLETIGTLAGGIAHDFNNILTPILGYSEMGLLSMPPDEPVHDYFSEIMHAAERAQTLIGQILTFSRAQEVTPSVISVKSVVSEALKLLRPSIPATITIEQHIDDNCRNILADPSQIHQIIVNLCTNAFQAMEDTIGVIRIEIKEIAVDRKLRMSLPRLVADSYVRLTISDNGPGMSEATMERIFEPFFTTKAKNKGTGLGLSVVHGIVTSSKGEITVDSHPGNGTTFNIYLPVIDAHVKFVENEKPLLKGSSSILFVDDEESSTKMMTAMLSKLGFRIDTSNSPIEAITLFRKNPGNFDLVITDLTMPEMNGTALAAELHRISPHMPIILMTGYDKDLGNRTMLHKVGISRILKKPAKMAQLVSTINEVMAEGIV
ncbi:MAG: PAS domain S-box protein [Chlorobiaceae bacterium]|nr:PAS domain S-box protein [Chlorobiaceae bacterium]